ncbi:major facilitator superfamily domain-containing protein [Aspergillus pseudotamarii]|uniref:Major facilitator superfamily domain-containing protein n=1 Tax=Aspergillus pseudotamarii TaxID=132259 RepID=A0A5N6T0Q5_ASPPS|nr:major facilitator superfamily domain-containing protein [Aspergillus pseudotamarii]KAE8139154.1 major facilitator superfamily domain-containing protein [Aspergillus pseudotamarii]
MAQSSLNGEKQPPTSREDGKSNVEDIVYPRGLKLALLLMSIFVGMFLVSLDRLIISTAIPQITNEFNSAGDIGWYGTAYLLTNCAFQLVFGKLYTLFRVKPIFLTSILLFEAGSALCGAAPNSVAFILGRAISGLGGGGILSGVIVVIVYAVPLHNRPKYQGLFGAVFAITSVTGPLVGGAFTTNVTWRWCFYINLPLGGVVTVLVSILLQVPDRSHIRMPLKDKLWQLNMMGLVALLPGVVCLCLALQLGGTTYAWSEGRVVALLILAFVLLIAFALIQIWKPEQAILPPRIFTQRSIASGFWVSSCLGAHMNLFVYYLPLWFQAIKGVSAVDSGIHLLPMLIPVVVASVITGQLVSRIGYYTPFMIFGACLTAIGTGLLTTLGISTSEGKWIGFQIIYGFGIGFCSQTPNMAAQTVLPHKDVAIGASLMFFGQQLFGAVFASVGQNVLLNQLAYRLAGIPSISPQLIQSTGATEFFNRVPFEDHAVAQEAYNDSLRKCFQVGLIMACLSVLGACSMEWCSVKKNLPPKERDGQQASEEGKCEGSLRGNEPSQVTRSATLTTEETAEKNTKGTTGSEDVKDKIAA